MLEASNESPTLLVVEDDPDLQAVLTRILTSEGYQVITATDGEAGVAEALGRAPDLVILDVMLPGMDGLEIARRIDRRIDRLPGLDGLGLCSQARDEMLQVNRRSAAHLVNS